MHALVSNEMKVSQLIDVSALSTLVSLRKTVPWRLSQASGEADKHLEAIDSDRASLSPAWR